MLKTICFTLAAVFAVSTAAQIPTRPDPADSKVAVPARPYESAFKDYRPYTDPEIARWREANDEMGRLNGHIGHVPGSVPPSAQPGRAAIAPKPAGHSGHGGHK